MAFVAAYDKRTGAKHSVPEHWLDHPILGQNLRKTPKTRAAAETKDDNPTTAPSGDDKKENHNAPRPR